MTKKPLITPAEINQKNREFWDKRNAAIQEEIRKAKDRPADIGQAFIPTNDAERVSGLVDPLEKLKTTSLVRKGEAFGLNGRGKSPITKKMESLLQKYPDMKNEELWSEVTRKLPKGWKVVNEPLIFPEPYIESPDDEMTRYSSFRVNASKIRKQLKQG